MVINNGIVVSQGMILNKVWGYHFQGEENIVEVYIRSLREKLNDKAHQLIGSGYKMDFLK
jgi:two-component system, OmpR family, response regulator